MEKKPITKKPTKTVFDPKVEITHNEYAALDLKPIAWAIVFASLVFAGTIILINEYEQIRGCNVNYLDNNGQLLNSCDLHD